MIANTPPPIAAPMTGTAVAAAKPLAVLDNDAEAEAEALAAVPLPVVVWWPAAVALARADLIEEALRPGQAEGQQSSLAVTELY